MAFPSRGAAAGISRVLLPLVVAVVGSAGVSFARHNPQQGAGVVTVAAILSIGLAGFGEGGAALAAIGVGAAASFAEPNGLGPLLVATGVVLTGDVGSLDRRLVRWRYVVEAVVSLPALAGLAATVAAQPSHRAVALGAAAALGAAITLWRNRAYVAVRYAVSPVAYAAAAGAIAVMLVPDGLDAFGDMPRATVTAAHSVAAGLALFLLGAVVDVLWAEWKAAR